MAPRMIGPILHHRRRLPWRVRALGTVRRLESRRRAAAWSISNSRTATITEEREARPYATCGPLEHIEAPPSRRPRTIGGRSGTRGASRRWREREKRFPEWHQQRHQDWLAGAEEGPHHAEQGEHRHRTGRRLRISRTVSRKKPPATCRLDDCTRPTRMTRRYVAVGRDRPAGTGSAPSIGRNCAKPDEAQCQLCRAT